MVGKLFRSGVLAGLALVGAGGGASAQRTERESVDSAGAQATGSSSGVSLSADGRFVVFSSDATNLVANDRNLSSDVFVHDRLTGVTALVSTDANGNQADDASFFFSCDAISDDGRFVGFTSDASNLVPGTIGFGDRVYVKDLQTGAIELVSVDSAGNEANLAADFNAISADGRFVVFDSLASNLVAGDTNGAFDVFVHDRQTGTTECASLDATGVPGDSDSEFGAVSADGRFVAFRSFADDLVSGDVNGAWDVFVRDRQSGTTERVSVDASGAAANGDSNHPSISADGRFVAFESAATNLVAGDTNGALDVFVHDRQTGATERMSVATGGAESDDDSERPCISADGVHVAFTGFADDLVAGDGNGWPDVFVHDRSTGATERMSVDAAGGDADAPSFDCAITADGRFVGFASFADDLVSSDTNADEDVFERGPWLTLEVDPAIVLSGNPLTFKTWSGQPLGATLLVTTALNGSPLFGPLIPGSFDAAGKWVFSATVPGGLAGNVVTFATFGIVPPGKVAISGPRNVSFQ
jgi:Tol biopolymer transport system component